MSCARSLRVLQLGGRLPLMHLGALRHIMLTLVEDGEDQPLAALTSAHCLQTLLVKHEQVRPACIALQAIRDTLLITDRFRSSTDH